MRIRERKGVRKYCKMSETSGYRKEIIGCRGETEERGLENWVLEKRNHKRKSECERGRDSEIGS